MFIEQLKRFFKAKNLLILGFFCLLIFPWLFTQTWGWVHFNSNTGVIGDTIGGITGPISGFLGAALVYLALKEQIKANELIYRQFEEQQNKDRIRNIVSTLTDQIKILRDDIKDFKFSVYNADYSTKEFYGAEAISLLLHTFPITHIEERFKIQQFILGAQQIRSFLERISYMLSYIDQTELDDVERIFLTKMVKETYSINLITPLNENIHHRLSNMPKCPVCKKKHGIPDDVYELHLFLINTYYVIELGE